jgi:hypothetical protein
MTDAVAEAIKHRHPKEWVFFWLSALFTVAVLLILLVLAIFRTEVIEMLETDYIEGYRAQHPDAANLTDKEILPLLPADEKQVLGCPAVRASRRVSTRCPLTLVCVCNGQNIWKSTGGGCAYYARAVS